MTTEGIQDVLMIPFPDLVKGIIEETGEAKMPTNGFNRTPERDSKIVDD